MSNDLRSKAIILHRTNYGESDRILNLLTPEGKVAALARGVRKEKSKLAGAVEPFSVSDVVIHQGRSDLGTLTSAKMLKFYSQIITDLNRLELAGIFLKKINLAADQVTSPEYFSLLEQSLAGLNEKLSISLVEAWFWLNFARISGEEVNLIYDINGEKLSPEMAYYWDSSELSLKLNPSGDIKSREIKLARFLLANPLAWATKVDNVEESLPPILRLAKSVNRLKN